jgi:hypothetical protein
MPNENIKCHLPHKLDSLEDVSRLIVENASTSKQVNQLLLGFLLF